MIFPRKKLILPCHKNGYLQSASDARKWRDRFKRNPLAKVADMFIPRPLRMSPGYPCCCGGGGGEGLGDDCTPCGVANTPRQWLLTISSIDDARYSGDPCYVTTDECRDYNGEYILTQEEEYPCLWGYADETTGNNGISFLLGIYSGSTYYLWVNANVEFGPSSEGCQTGNMFPSTTSWQLTNPCCGRAAVVFYYIEYGLCPCNFTYDGNKAVFTLEPLPCE